MTRLKRGCFGFAIARNISSCIRALSPTLLRRCFFIPTRLVAYLNSAASQCHKSFRGERMGTPFSLLKCLLKHHRQHFEPFFWPKMHHIVGFCIDNLKQRPRSLDPDSNFRLARQRSHCSCFTKRPLHSVYVYVFVCVCVCVSYYSRFVVMAAQRLQEAASNIHPEQIASDLFTRAKTFFLDLKAKIA